MTVSATSHVFDFCGTVFEARPAGTLWWAERRTLIVADLHLGKAERMARRNGLLVPPYEVAETVARLRAEIEETAPAQVIALGDSFDDLDAMQALPDPARRDLLTLAAGRRWIWITGNHDPGPVDLPGDHLAEHLEGGLVFRHIAEAGASGEISGHFHPKLRLAGRRRPAFLVNEARVILPAFGTYTGGLDARDPVLAALMRPAGFGIVTGAKCLAVPLE